MHALPQEKFALLCFFTHLHRTPRELALERKSASDDRHITAAADPGGRQPWQSL
jgi:hypothetical protein